jgi:hypothetical protein
MAVFDTNLDRHPLIQTIRMKEMVAGCKSVCPSEIDVHNPATNGAHIGRSRRQTRLIVKRVFIA